MVVAMWSVLALAGASVAYLFAHFLLASPETALVHPDQVQIASNHYVSDASVVQIFAPDRGHSILRVPLSQRRRQIEAIPWVEHATVRRAFPNKIEVDISERTPIAFLRQSNDLALVDAHGVILDRPVEGTFHFPVVTGISTDMPQDDREIRMQMFSAFSQQVDSARPGSMDLVSEVDLSDANDLRATITGLQNATVSGASSSEADASSGNAAQADSPILVHFGDGDFGAKYQSLVDNIAQWRATVGRVESVDLRFVKEAVVNPDTTAAAHVHVAKLVTTTKQAAKKSR
jgi:cell division protein FtsQ